MESASGRERKEEMAVLCVRMRGVSIDSYVA
jgi:hypothetical protein